MRPTLTTPSLALGACLVSALAACTGAGGRVDARWGPPDTVSRMRSAATGAWCPERGVVLVQATDQDRAVGFSWRFDTLRPDSIPLTPAATGDTIGRSASAALRDVRLQELRGYQSVAGLLRVTGVDSTRISAHLEGVMLRVGRADTTPLTADFRNVVLRRDTTLCHR